MNKIYFIFKTVEDANAAMEAFKQKVMFTYGSSVTEISINPSDRREALDILKNCGLEYTMR